MKRIEAPLTDNDIAVLYVAKRFATQDKPLSNDEILMLLCLLEWRGDVVQMWHVTPQGREAIAGVMNDDYKMSADDQALLARARAMAASIDRS